METQDRTEETHSVSWYITRAAQGFFMGTGIFVTCDWLFDQLWKLL